MGILNYLLNQRPENKRRQELHEFDMLTRQQEQDTYRIQKKALENWMASGRQGPPPPLPAVPSGGGPAAPQVPPSGGGAPAADMMSHLLPGGAANFPSGTAKPEPNLAEVSAMPSDPGPKTSLSSSYQGLKDLALAYMETGDPAAAQLGMDLLQNVAAQEQQANQFDRTAGQTDRNLDLGLGNLEERQREGRFTRGDKFTEDVRQFDVLADQRAFSNETDRIRALTDRTNGSSGPIGQVPPSVYTPESVEAFNAKFNSTGIKDYGLLVRDIGNGDRFLADQRELGQDLQSTRNRVGAALRYAGMAEGMTYSAGVVANAEEWWKDLTGSQDEVSLLRTNLTKLRNESVIADLPPGVASDKDIEIALKGFIDVTRTNSESTASFLRGLAKMDAIVEAQKQARLRYGDATGSYRGFDEYWENNGEALIRAKFDDYKFSVSEGDVSPKANRTYTPETQEILNKYGVGGTY